MNTAVNMTPEQIAKFEQFLAWEKSQEVKNDSQKTKANEPSALDELGFDTQADAQKLFNDKVEFTNQVLPEFEHETDRDDLILTAMSACSGADTPNDVMLVVPDELKKNVAIALGTQAFGYVYSTDKLMTGIVKNKLAEDPKHKPAIALYDKELPNPFRPHTEEDLKFLGHQILVTSNADIGLSKLNEKAFIGTKEYKFKEGDYSTLPDLTDEDKDFTLARTKYNLRMDQKEWFVNNRSEINARISLIAEKYRPSNVETKQFIQFCLLPAYASFISNELFKSVLERALNLASETLKDNLGLFVDATEKALIEFESKYVDENNISTKMLAKLINKARVNGLKVLGHIKVASYLDDLDLDTDRLTCFEVGTSAVALNVLKQKIAQQKAAV